MVNVFIDLQKKAYGIASQLQTTGLYAREVQKRYFATNASNVVSAIASDNDPATINGRLTKSRVINGITISESLVNFLGNAAVSTGDNTQRAMLLTNGSATLAVALDEDLEQIGFLLKEIGVGALSLKTKCQEFRKQYFATTATIIVSALSDGDLLPGVSVRKSDIVDAITLAEQFINLMDNMAVATSDYDSTVARLLTIGQG